MVESRRPLDQYLPRALRVLASPRCLACQ